MIWLITCHGIYLLRFFIRILSVYYSRCVLLLFFSLSVVFIKMFKFDNGVYCYWVCCVSLYSLCSNLFFFSSSVVPLQLSTRNNYTWNVIQRSSFFIFCYLLRLMSTIYNPCLRFGRRRHLRCCYWCCVPHSLGEYDEHFDKLKSNRIPMNINTFQTISKAIDCEYTQISHLFLLHAPA